MCENPLANKTPRRLLTSQSNFDATGGQNATGGMKKS